MEEKFKILEAQLERKVVPNVFISGDVLENKSLVWTVSIDYEDYPIMVQDEDLERALSRAIRSFFLQKKVSALVLPR